MKIAGVTPVPIEDQTTYRATKHTDDVSPNVSAASQLFQDSLGEVTSQNLRLQNDRHFVGITDTMCGVVGRRFIAIYK